MFPPALRCFIALSLAAGIRTAPAADQPAAYTVKDLGATFFFPGGNNGAPGLNAGGRVLNNQPANGVNHPFLSGFGGDGFRDLGNGPGARAAATALNDKAQVVGEIDFSGDTRHAFLTAPNGGAFTDLGVPAGALNTTATAVNNAGQVAGTLTTAPSSLNHAFFLGAAGGAFTDLGTLGGTSSGAAAINAAGQVAGYIQFPSGNRHAFLGAPGGGAIRDLGSLGPDDGDSYASGVNDKGQVVGVTQTANGTTYHAFLSDPDGGALRDLGALNGGDSAGNAVNNKGQVVGGASKTFQGSADTVSHAVIATVDGGMVDLNKLVGPRNGTLLSNALDINDAGQILCQGSTRGIGHLFLLTPVTPVPATASVSVSLETVGPVATVIFTRTGGVHKKALEVAYKIKSPEGLAAGTDYTGAAADGYVSFDVGQKTAALQITPVPGGRSGSLSVKVVNAGSLVYAADAPKKVVVSIQR